MREDGEAHLLWDGCCRLPDAAVAVSILAMRTVELDSRIVIATMVGTLAATGRRFGAMVR